MRVIADIKTKTRTVRLFLSPSVLFHGLDCILANSAQNEEAGETGNKGTYLSRQRVPEPCSSPVLGRESRVAFQAGK